MDRNDYYGGESTSLNLNQVIIYMVTSHIFFWLNTPNFGMAFIFIFGLQLWKRFRGDDKPPENLGSSKDYNIDMIPKVIYLFTIIT